jgi:hypothetical protein
MDQRAVLVWTYRSSTRARIVWATSGPARPDSFGGRGCHTRAAVSDRVLLRPSDLPRLATVARVVSSRFVVPEDNVMPADADPSTTPGGTSSAASGSGRRLRSRLWSMKRILAVRPANREARCPAGRLGCSLLNRVRGISECRRSESHGRSPRGSRSISSVRVLRSIGLAARADLQQWQQARI